MDYRDYRLKFISFHEHNVDRVRRSFEIKMKLITRRLSYAIDLCCPLWTLRYCYIVDLVNRGCNVNILTFGWRTTLHEACLKGYSRTVEVLLLNGAEYANKNHYSVIHLICQHRFFETVHALLRFGIDDNFKKWYMETPLNAACQIGDSNIVQLLLKYDADISPASVSGNSSLHDVCTMGHC